jgi:hypothetical protein
MKRIGAHLATDRAAECVAPDASSGVARKARSGALWGACGLRDYGALTRRYTPRGGRGVRPYTNCLAETA